jgi:hypothetical protein
MKRIAIFFVTSILISMIAFGCASMTSGTIKDKQLEDSAFDLAKDALVGLSDAYEMRDETAFMRLVSAKYLGGYQDLEEALSEDFDRFDSADVDIIPERVWVDEDGKIFVDTGWRKTTFSSTSPTSNLTSGTTTFIFIRYEEDVVKLFSMRGDQVFPFGD